MFNFKWFLIITCLVASSRQGKLKGTCSNAEATCVPRVLCPAHVRAERVEACTNDKLSFVSNHLNESLWICCTTGQDHWDKKSETERKRGNIFVNIDPVTLHLVAGRSRAEVAELRTREARLLSIGHSAILYPGSASYGHYRNSRLFNVADLSEVMEVASKALEIAIATRAFKDRQGITNQQLELGMVQQDLRPTPLGAACIPRPVCYYIPERHRRIDGTCNNIANPTWGSWMTPYSRLLPPSYSDGIWTPRASVVPGYVLPSARQVSTTIFSNRDVPNYEYTLMVMQFGQFISHDITQSIDASYANGSAVSCCTEDGSSELDYNERHYACMPITIPEDDEFFGYFKQRCMNFVRSVLAPRHDCTLGYAQQMNKITHFIDASSVYGSSEEQTNELRSFQYGRLNVFHDFGRDMLPLTKDSDACLTMEQGSACFTSGDTRTNQMVSLVVLHTIFLREHNRIAGELYNLNPHWDDHRLFMEARRVLIAEMQVIIYKEYLPVLIGEAAMDQFGIRIRDGVAYGYDYDPRVEPSVTNEFASAGLRFGHSMVDGLLKVYGRDSMEEMIAIPEVMFQPARMRKVQFMDEMLNTLTSEPIQEVDHNIADALTKYMFRAGGPFGVDLAAFNVQRGRDHGLRPYNDYRELVGLPKIRDFEEFGSELGEKLRSIYASVDDVDLWVGGLLEEKAPGSLLGYTFRDIIADQFYRLKKGDKYFFENHPSINPGFFQPYQLAEVRKASMSRIICDNSDGMLLARQAPNAFKKPGVPGNEYVDCAEIPRVDLMYWRE